MLNPKNFETMTQFANISKEAVQIINKFFSNNKKRGVFNEYNTLLMVSLYSLQPYVNPKVLSILSEDIISLEDYLSSEEITILQKEYKAVIEYCYKYNDYNIDRKKFESLGHTHIPTSLIELCISLANIETNKNVYLPYAGEGVFASYCQECNIDGFEINTNTWAFSQILATTSSSNINIECGDILNTSKKYDYIFSFPPILPKNVSKKIIEHFYQLITKQLNENGQFYAILPISFCFASNGWFDIRKIAQDYHKELSVMVLALPPMLQPITSVSLCLVKFYKSKQNIVTLADITSEKFYTCQEFVGAKYYSLKVQSILETIQKQDKKYVWIGDASNLISSLNMTPSRYLFKQILPKAKEGEVYIKIKELVELIPTTSYPMTNELEHVLGMKELSFNYLNCNIKYKDIPKIKVNIYGHIISEQALLVGFIGGKFKIGRLSEDINQEQIILRSEIIPFKLKSNLITEDFLLRAIMSEVSEHQGILLSNGSTITKLSKNDFLDIYICVPSIEKQNELCKEDTRRSLTESDRKIIESYEDFRRDIHMKKHAIGQTLANFNNWWKLLEKAKKMGNGIIVDENAIISKIHKVYVKDIFENLENSISKLTTQLNKFDSGYGLIKDDIALTEFIENYIQKNKSPLFRFEYNSIAHRSQDNIPSDITGEYCILKGDPIEYIKFPKEALVRIFDNIVSNARAHGFNDREEFDNIIKIEIDSNGLDYIVSISNNGKALDTSMKSEDITIYGHTSGNANTHLGIGGYEIKRLMEEFGDNLEIISEPNSEFTVIYKLIFHDTNVLKIL